MQKFFFFFFLFILGVGYAQPTDSLFFKKYQIKKVRESSVGVYYARLQDTILIHRLDTFLISRSEALFKKFNHRISTPVQFEFYPTISASQCLCGYDTLTINNKSWAPLGCAHYIRKIQMVIPGVSEFSDSVYFTWGGFSTVLFHEYIHTITYDIVGKKRINRIPWWITEGIACYEAKQFHYTRFFKEYVQKRLDEQTVPSVRRLNNDYVTVDRLYGWSFLFCDFIIKTYGFEKLLEIQQHFEKFPKQLGKSYKTLNKEWLEYLRNKPVED